MIPVPPKSATIGGLLIDSGSGGTSLFASAKFPPSVIGDVTTNLPLSPTADCKTIVCPHVASVVVVMQSETWTDAPPGEKTAVEGPKQFGAVASGVVEKNAETAALAGEAIPNAATKLTAAI